MNGTTEETYQSITVYPKNYKTKVYNSEVTKSDDAEQNYVSKEEYDEGSDFHEMVDIKDVTSGEDSAAEVSSSVNDIDSFKQSSTTNSVVKTIPKPGLNNLVVVSSLQKVATQNSKLYFLNGNVLKEAKDPETCKNDNFNIICIGNIIKPANNDAVVNSVSEVGGIEKKDAEKPKSGKPTTLSTFIQLDQNNIKNISSNIKLNVTSNVANFATKTTKNNAEILRSKLECGTQINHTVNKTVEPLTAPMMRKIVEKNRKIFRKDQAGDSEAVAMARNYLIETRRSLIQEAMKKQLPMHKPPAGYIGPTYTCEECFDTFTSEGSLFNHKDRRSVLFSYACPDCCCSLEFYNRCTFSMHIRSHNTSIKANSLTISIIPADKLHFKLREDDEINDNTKSASFDYIRQPVTRPYDSSVTAPANVSSCPVRIRPIKKKRVLNRDVIPEDTVVAADKEALTNGTTSMPVRNDIKASSEDTDPAFQRENLKRKADEQPCQDELVGIKKKHNLNSSIKIDKVPPKVIAAEKCESKINNTVAPVPVSLDKISSSVSVTPVIAKPVEEITLTSSDDDEDEIESSYEESSIGNVECRECNQEVSNLTRHFRGSNRPLKEYPCNQCQFFNPSPCALSAHVRMMHLRTQPFVCPDCGFFFNQLETFLRHVKTVCFYNFKNIRFKCPECSLLKPSVPQFSEHLKRCHIREVYKCSICITSSYSTKVVQEHMEKVHPESTSGVLEGYRCMLCPNLLIAKQSIALHIKKHVFGLQFLRYVYICNCCNKYASGKMSKFEAHYANCPERVESSPSPEPAPRPPNNVTKKSTPRSRKSPDKNNVPREKDPLSVEEWEADKLKAEYGVKTKICVMCRTTRLNDHSKSLFCKACVSYVNAEEPAEGSAVNENCPATEIGRSKRKFKCKLCKQFMNRDWATITRHYEQDHHADFEVAPRSKGAGRAETNAKRKTSTSKNEAAAAIAAKLTKLAESKYSCVKCGLCTNEREEFHSHLAGHRSPDSTDLLCLECGEGFIVKPSLEKHLVVIHKIRDLKEYFKENKVEVEEDPKPERALSVNQCEVCFLQCDSKQTYDKHIRTHGMAFVAMQSRVRS